MDKTCPINTLFDKLLIVGFSAIISIPFIFADKMGGGISNSENRRLAMMPFVNENHELIPDLEFSELQERTEQWIDDNAYGRDYFYDLMLKANYYLFDVVEKKDLLLGDDNWTFYYNSDIIKDFQHNNIPSQETLNGWVNSFKQISNYYEEKDIKFMGIFLPDKKTVYKEYYPKGIQEIQHQSRSDLLREKFQEANVNFYFAEDDLIHAKGKRLLYSKTFDSAHWNSYGAFVGYQNFMREVKKYFPNIKVVDESDFIINEYCSRSKFLSKIFKINVKNFREIFPDFTHRKRGSDFITVPFLSSGSHALRLPSAFPFSVPCLEYTLSVLQQSNLTPHISGLYALPSN